MGSFDAGRPALERLAPAPFPHVGGRVALAPMGLRRFRRRTTRDEATADEIRSELTELPGVGDVHLAPGEQDVAVETDDEVLADDEILAAIGRAGPRPGSCRDGSSVRASGPIPSTTSGRRSCG